MSVYLPTSWSSLPSEAFDREIDRMFNDALHSMGTTGRRWVPACNAWEDDNGFYVEIALPGWDPNDISVEVDNRVLAVKGEPKGGAEQSGTYHLREIGCEQFVRFFSLPDFVDHDKASATQKHGLLTIAFPKKEEAKVRRILIEGQ